MVYEWSMQPISKWVHVGVLRGSSALTLPKELNNFFFVTKIIRKERDRDKGREIDREKKRKREEDEEREHERKGCVQVYVGRENDNLQGNI